MGFAVRTTGTALPLLMMLMMLTACSPSPVYRGEGVRCAGGRWPAASFSGGTPRTAAQNRLMSEIDSWIGTPYLYGGESRSGVDCSGFTQAVYASVDIEIPRTASRQAAAAGMVDRADIRFGDLIFFNTTGSGISHVGIYVGNGFFVHSSTRRGVVRESIASEYYADRIVSVGRFLE